MSSAVTINVDIFFFYNLLTIQQCRFFRHQKNKLSPSTNRYVYVKQVRK